MAQIKHILPWLASLSQLTRPPVGGVTKQLLGTYATFLADDFSDAVFNRDSLKTIAEGSEFFPSYNVLKTALTEWRDTHAARVTTLLPSDLRDRIDALTKGEAWQERINAERAEAEADWSNPANVMASAAKLDGHPLRRLLGLTLAALVARHAKHNVGFLPPEFLVNLPENLRNGNNEITETRAQAAVSVG